jgi:cation diffusion facilitator family transporter
LQTCPGVLKPNGKTSIVSTPEKHKRLNLTDMAALKKELQQRIDRKARMGYAAGWISVFVNLLLFILKYWAGLVSGSVAILADAWHTLSDSLTSLIVIVGTRISSKPADREHPFGHGRAELIATIIIGVLLAVIAFNFASESIVRLRDHQPASFGPLAIGAVIASIIGKELLAQYAFWMARKSGNPSIRADAWHHRSDAISSVVVLAGIVVGSRLWWMDGVLGLLVAALIAYAAYEVIRDGINPLLGEKPNEQLIRKVRLLAREASGMETYPHHIHLHRYGEHVELTLHIRLPEETSLAEAHRIATLIEEHLQIHLQMEPTIHLEPL